MKRQMAQQIRHRHNLIYERRIGMMYYNIAKTEEEVLRRRKDWQGVLRAAQWMERHMGKKGEGSRWVTRKLPNVG